MIVARLENLHPIIHLNFVVVLSICAQLEAAIPNLICHDATKWTASLGVLVNGLDALKAEAVGIKGPL